MGLIDVPASWNISVHLDELPFETREEVLAMFPSYFSDGDNAIRDAMADALLETMARRSSDLAAYAAASTAQFASGNDLDAAGEREDLARNTYETDAEYRARILGDVEALTPQSMLDEVYAITSEFSSTRPYYMERPHDEAYIFDDDGDDSAAGNLDGWYHDDDEGIEASDRQYDVRGNKPKHVLIWDENHSDAATPNETETTTFNAQAAPIVCIPPFPLPGTREDDDAFFSDAPDTLVDLGTGALTDAAAEAASDMGDIFDVADEAGDHSLGFVSFDPESEITLVVSKIETLFANRCSFPVEPMLLLDPSLPL